MSTHKNITDMSDSVFRNLADLVYSECGILLSIEKKAMVQSRLRSRLRSLRLSTYDNYVSFVCSKDGMDERSFLISSLTTNVSHFFREEHHFKILEKNLREQTESASETKKKLRIWSAGCSNGQEPYSIAMMILDTIENCGKMDIRILATDIDSEVIKFAKTGVYPLRLLNNLDKTTIEKHFTKVNDGTNGENYAANAELKNLISFKELNLLENWPMKGKFDAIFCRNVVIYFDNKTQNSLWPRFRKFLCEDGLFFLGHSERISDTEKFGFSTCGPTTYKKMQLEKSATNSIAMETQRWH